MFRKLFSSRNKAEAALKACMAALVENKPEEALAHCKRGLKKVPHHAALLRAGSEALQELHDIPSAQVWLEKSLCIEEDATAYVKLAQLQAQQGQPGRSKDNAMRALQLSHDSALLSRLAPLFVQLRCYQQALTCYEVIVRHTPAAASALSNMSWLLHLLNRDEEALSASDQALAINPEHALAHYNRGNALLALGETRQASVAYSRALELQPNHAEAKINFCLTRQDMGRYEEAIVCWEEAIANDPDSPLPHINLSLILLLLGQFEAGWKMYAWRRHTSIFQKALEGLPAMPAWDGQQDISGQTLLVFHEQGLGDTLQFCRFIPLLKQRGARVAFCTPVSLHPVLRSLDGVWRLVDKTDIPDCRLHCALLDLPALFHVTESSIPAQVPYLSAPPDKLQYWHRRLSLEGQASAPLIGLVFSGSLTLRGDHLRSIPLKQLIAVLPQGLRYICLQKEIRPADQQTLYQLCGNLVIECPQEEIADFGDTAALCQLADTIISVDTSVAHLAGAMHRPLCLLLPYAPDWRWQLHREDSPWYPDIKLYRCEAHGQWSSALERLGNDLARLYPQSRSSSVPE